LTILPSVATRTAGATNFSTDRYLYLYDELVGSVAKLHY
jgi:hypothetical protein